MLTLAGDFAAANVAEVKRGEKFFEWSNHLRNVLATVSDRKIAHTSNSSTIDYYEADVVSAQDYYPFGMIMPGRSITNESVYRYGFNTQERVDFLSKNVYTAKYWEYDGRIARRWNVDPIYNTDISRYSVNGNNPIYFLDPNGDFKTKFGAQWYKFWHGKSGNIGQNTIEGSKRNGQWYIQREAENGSKGDGKQNLDEVIVYSPVYGDRKNSKSGNQGMGDPSQQAPFGISSERFDQAVDKTAHYIKRNVDDIWYSTPVRALVPDYVILSGSGSVSSFITGGQEGTLTLMLRGKDPGLYINTTTNMGWVTSAGADVGCSVGAGYYIGDAKKFSSSMLGGWQGSGSVGIGLKAIAGGSANQGVDIGFDDRGRLTTVTGKIGISVGVGISTPVLQGGISAGKATNARPLIKF